MNNEKATYVVLGGMVFMYGNMQIIAEKKEEKVFLTKLAGPDGSRGEAEETEINIAVFNKLIDAVESIDCEKNLSEEDNIYIALEEIEETGAYEWYVAVGDGDGNDIFCLCGNNPESTVFKRVSEALQVICPDFGCVDAFFKGVNE